MKVPLCQCVYQLGTYLHVYVQTETELWHRSTQYNTRFNEESKTFTEKELDRVMQRCVWQYLGFMVMCRPFLHHFFPSFFCVHNVIRYSGRSAKQCIEWWHSRLEPTTVQTTMSYLRHRNGGAPPRKRWGAQARENEREEVDKQTSHKSFVFLCHEDPRLLYCVNTRERWMSEPN